MSTFPNIIWIKHGWTTPKFDLWRRHVIEAYKHWQFRYLKASSTNDGHVNDIWRLEGADRKNGVELLESASNVGHCLGIAEMGCGQGLWEIFYLFKTRGKQRHYVSICCIWVYILFKPCFLKCSAILTSSSPMSVFTLFIWYLLVM